MFNSFMEVSFKSSFAAQDYRKIFLKKKSKLIKFKNTRHKSGFHEIQGRDNAIWRSNFWNMWTEMKFCKYSKWKLIFFNFLEICPAKFKFWIENIKELTFLITFIDIFKLKLHITEVEKNFHFPTVFLQIKLEYLVKKFDVIFCVVPPLMKLVFWTIQAKICWHFQSIWCPMNFFDW